MLLRRGCQRKPTHLKTDLVRRGGNLGCWAVVNPIAKLAACEVLLESSSGVRGMLLKPLPHFRPEPVSNRRISDNKKVASARKKHTVPIPDSGSSCRECTKSYQISDPNG